MFESFLGNAPIVTAVRQMLAADRLPQTLLFAGPEGVGKATLARLIAAAFLCRHAAPDPCGRCPACRRVLESDLSRPEHQELFEERARLSSDRRRENPLVVGSHPDFLTFPPDGPLAQVSIEQGRRLKEHAQFGPAEGRRRLFLVDHADRIDLPAANSLLKTLEEPPPYLTLILTAENAFDLLPTIRSRSIPFYFAPLGAEEMDRFLASRGEIASADRAKLRAWSRGSPGRALAIDVATYEKRRQAMLALLRTAAGEPFGELLRHTEALARSKQEKLELLLDALYDLLADLLRLLHGGAPLVNPDIGAELAALASRVDFDWLQSALARADELDSLARRNIQKQIALEAIAVELRPAARPTGV